MSEIDFKEVSEKTEKFGVRSSSVGSAYTDAFIALKEAFKLDEGYSMALPMDKFKEEFLRLVCDEFVNVGNRVCVVVPWPADNVYEIRRLPDGTKADSFYLALNDERGLPGSASNLDFYEKMLGVINSYFDKDEETLKKYDANYTVEFKVARVISKVYLQRRCSSLAAFKNHKQGSTNAIKEAICKLIEKGVLTEVDTVEATRRFGTNSSLYIIN